MFFCRYVNCFSFCFLTPTILLFAGFGPAMVQKSTRSEIDRWESCTFPPRFFLKKKMKPLDLLIWQIRTNNIVTLFFTHKECISKALFRFVIFALALDVVKSVSYKPILLCRWQTGWHHSNCRPCCACTITKGDDCWRKDTHSESGGFGCTGKGGCGAAELCSRDVSRWLVRGLGIANGSSLCTDYLFKEFCIIY